MGKRATKFFLIFILSFVVKEQSSIFATATYECGGFFNPRSSENHPTAIFDNKTETAQVEFPSNVSHSQISSNDLRDLKRAVIDHIRNISFHKTSQLNKLKLVVCGPQCLKLHSKGPFAYEIRLDSQLKTPQLKMTKTTKILSLPNTNSVKEPQFIEALRTFLVGHEIHPLSHQPKRHETPASLDVALSALDTALAQSSKGMLVVGPSALDSDTLLVEALKVKITELNSKRISFVVTPSKAAAKHLTAKLKNEFANTSVNIANLNDKETAEVMEEIEKTQLKSKPTIFILNVSRLTNISEDMLVSLYEKVIQDINGIFVQDAHQLNLPKNHIIYSRLIDDSKAFIFGMTQNISSQIFRSFFEHEHWMHLNSSENLAENYSAESMISNIASSITTGNATPTRHFNFFNESNFKHSDVHPLFIKSEGRSDVISQRHYQRLTEIMAPVIKNNKKGLIVVNSVLEAETLQTFLSSTFPEVIFELDRSEKDVSQQNQLLDKARYVISTKSLSSNFIQSDFTAYIDLNPSDSIYNALYRLHNILRLDFKKTNADVLFLLDLNQQTKNKSLLGLWQLISNSPNKIIFSEQNVVSENLLTIEDLELSLDDSVPMIMRDFNKLLKNTTEPKKNSSSKIKVSYVEAKKWMAENAPEVKTLRAYRAWHTTAKPDFLQYDPSVQYKDHGWISWTDFLNSNNFNKHAREFLSYEEAKIWMAKNFPEIKTNSEFLTWARTDQRPPFIPSNPNVVYKDMGWLSAADFLSKVH